MKRVFLGGTYGSTWRKTMINLLSERGIFYFDPVVDDWDETAQANEVRKREECDVCLYVVTPRMAGVYAIAEVVEDSIKRPEKTVFVYLRHDAAVSGFTEGQCRSLDAVAKMVVRNGARFCASLIEAADAIAM